MCTSHLSPHHLKCYKLLKYLVNGEPFPRVTPTATIIKPFLGPKTIFHSYALKFKVWDHKFKEECSEKVDLSSCFYRVIRSLEDDEDKYDDVVKRLPSKESQSILRLRTLQKGIEKIKTTPTEAEFCRYIEPRGFQKCPAQISAILLCARHKVLPVIMAMVLLFISTQLETAKKDLLVVGAVLFLCSIICLFLATHGTRYLEQRFLTVRSPTQSDRRLLRCLECLLYLLFLTLFAFGFFFLFYFSTEWLIKTLFFLLCFVIIISSLQCYSFSDTIALVFVFLSESLRIIPKGENMSI